MNIAFTSIVLFIILAPGFAFKSVYHATRLSVRDPNRNIITDLTWSIIPSLFFHTLAIFVVENFTNYHVDFTLLGNLTLGIDDAKKVDESFTQLREYLYPVFFYNFIIFIIAAFLGLASRRLIRLYKLDRKLEFLRFPNKWHYIFSGECLDFPDVPDSFDDIAYKTIDVLCKVNGNSVIYIGQLYNYYVDSKGDLDGVHLKFPMRRNFDNDDLQEHEFYEIPSRFIVIPSSEIININVKYFSLEEIEDIEYNIPNSNLTFQ